MAGFNHYVLGDFDQGIEALERAWQIGEALDDYRLDTSWSLGYFYASLGEWEKGIEMCQRGLDGSRDPLNTAVAMGFLGHAQLQKGDVDQALETLRESVERLRETGMLQLLGWFSTFLAEAHLARGDADAAHGAAQDGLEATRKARFRYGTGLAQHSLGRSALAANRLGEARQQLDEALDLFEELEVPFEVARVRLDLARLAGDHGNAESSREHLEASRGLFARLGLESFVGEVPGVEGDLVL